MATLERLFVEYCVSGDVNSLTKILKENIIDIHTDNELGFRWAFTNANVQVIDFLLHIHHTIPKYSMINIHINDDEIFYQCCFRNSWMLNKYLIKKTIKQPEYGLINIHCHNYAGFKSANIYKNKLMATHLVSLGCCVHTNEMIFEDDEFIYNIFL